MTLDFHSDAIPGNDVGLCPHFAPIAATGKSVFVDSGVVIHVNVPLTYKLILDQTTYGHDEVESQLPQPPPPGGGVAEFTAG